MQANNACERRGIQSRGRFDEEAEVERVASRMCLAFAFSFQPEGSLSDHAGVDHFPFGDMGATVVDETMSFAAGGTRRKKNVIL